MIIYDELYTYLQSQETITDLVGTRIYALHFSDKSQLPAIVLTQTGSEHDYQLRSKAGSAVTTVELAVHTTDLVQTIQISDALKTVLQGQVSVAIGNLHCAFVRLAGVSDSSYYVEDQDVWVFVRSSDYEFRHAE